MKTKLLGLMLLVGASAFAATYFSIGVGIGTPGYYAAPPAPVAVRPAYPGPGYNWVDGYWAPNGAWVAGYWAPPAYIGSYRTAPRYYDRDDRGYNGGYWRGERDRDHRGHAFGHDR
jgi:hypothetical protein